MDGYLPGAIDDVIHQEWKDLDRLFVQFWTSHSIHPQVMNAAGWEDEDFRGNAQVLLPESTRREIVGLVEVSY